MNKTSNRQKEHLRIRESVHVQVTVMGRYHLTPGRTTLPPAKGLHDLDMWVLPSVFKTVSTLYKSLEHFESPSSANSKRNPGNKQMNKNILPFHMEHLDRVRIEVHSPQRGNWNNHCACFNQFMSLKKKLKIVIFFHQC